jgi:hypothetical protein
MLSFVLAALTASIGAPATLAAQTAPAVQAPAPANGVGSAFELTFWQSVAGSDDQALFDAYLARYPDGTFSGLARAKIAALQRALPVQMPVQMPVQAAVQPAAQPVVAAPDAVPALAPVPASVPVALPAPEPAPALVPTPAVLIAAPAPAAAPVLAAAPGSAAIMPQTAEMIPANAALAPAEPSTPLARLLAQLRGTGVAAPAEAAPVAPVQLAAASAPVPAGPPLAPAASPPAAYASARPVMLPVPDVAMPAHFCSNDARNAFHNSAYRPAVEAATHNNDAAVTYLRQLQQTYDRGQLGRDTAALNAIAAEARTYQAEAARAYTMQAALVRQFDALMAVPLHTCMASAQ